MKKKKINKELGAPIEGKKKKKNRYLKPSGGLDLIEIFPSYEAKKKRKKKRW